MAVPAAATGCGLPVVAEVLAIMRWDGHALGGVFEYIALGRGEDAMDIVAEIAGRRIGGCHGTGSQAERRVKAGTDKVGRTRADLDRGYALDDIARRPVGIGRIVIKPNAPIDHASDDQFDKATIRIFLDIDRPGRGAVSLKGGDPPIVRHRTQRATVRIGPERTSSAQDAGLANTADDKVGIGDELDALVGLILAPAYE